MQRKLICAAVMASLTTTSALAATSDVDIYGVVAMSLDSVDTGNGPTLATQGTRTTKVASNASRLGFRGKEKLDDSLSALWQIESTIYVDGTSASTLATRNSFAGLQHADLGTLLLGRHDTSYKAATRKLDTFGLLLADNRSLLGGVTGKSAWLQFDGRRPGIVVYQSPTWNGFSFSADYVASSAYLATQSKGAGWSFAAIYRQHGWYGTLAHESHRLGSAATGTFAGAAAGIFASAGSKESATKLGLGYEADAFALSAVYETTRDSLGGTGAPALVVTCTMVGQNCYGHHAYYLAGSYRNGRDTFRLAYGKVGQLAGAAAGSDTSARQVSAGYDHSLSKRTRLFALYTRLSNGAGINYGLSSTTVTTGATPAAGNGATLSGASVGMRHAF